MKKILTTTLLAGMIAAPAVFADSEGTLTLDYPGNSYHYNDGGEFQAKIVSTTSGTPLSSPFYTFCVEITDEFSPGGMYYYHTASSSQGNPGTIPLSNATEWLYSQFQLAINNSSAVSSYFPDYVSSDSYVASAHAGELQAAIWYFQGGQVNGNGAFAGQQTINGIAYDFDNGSGSNPFYLAALAEFGDLATAQAAYSGNAVQVLVLGTSAGAYNSQDQLVLMPSVPDGGLTIGLLGGALVGLQALRRKLSC